MTKEQIEVFVENVVLLDGKVLTGAEIYQLSETGDFQFDDNELFVFGETHVRRIGNKVLVDDDIKYKLALDAEYTLVVNNEGDISVFSIN